MNDVTIASSEADASAVSAVEQHHALMAGALGLKVEALATLARLGPSEELLALRDDLVEWGWNELLPHARAEEGALYQAAAARPEGWLLVAAMMAEHATIGDLVDALAKTTEPVDVAMAAGALQVAFSMHVAKENDQILPLLVAAPDVSVADLLRGMHELLGDGAGRRGHESGQVEKDDHEKDLHEEGQHEKDHHEEGQRCGCGELDPPTWPELDAREIPHAIRHATVLGALDSVLVGRGLILVAPHDPRPLLKQIEQREPGAFEVSYLELGPEAWRLSLERVAR
jgi:uncharacterized protein (DUF2249 family)